MTPSRRRRYALLALVLAALAMAAWWDRRDEAFAPHVRTIGIAERSVDLRAVAALHERDVALDALRRDAGFDPPTAATTTSPWLFDHTAPLAARIEELDRRARRGEAAAGCQLGFELLQCRRAQELRSHFENIEVQVSRYGTQGGTPAEIDARIDAAMEKRDRHRVLLAACEGVDPRRWAEPARYLYAAAEAGHVPSMREALSHALYQPDALFRDPGLIAQWRASAPRYFQRLLAAGDPYLIGRLSAADVQTGDALLDLLPPPWNRGDLARALMRQRTEHVQPDLARAHPDPTPADVREEARALYRMHFAPHEAAHRATQAPLGPERHDDLSVHACARLDAAQSARR